MAYGADVPMEKEYKLVSSNVMDDVVTFSTIGETAAGYSCVANEDRSGDIGAIIYEDECATLKKIEFVHGDDWLHLVPLNPLYKPETIENEGLEHCRVISVPRLLL